MKGSNLYYGNTLIHSNSKEVASESIMLQDEAYFKIENYDQMPPFFMTIVSDVDFWMFISSTGGLTAGRINPENALFPYYTDDKIHDSAETTGSHTTLIVTKDQRDYLWKPFIKHQYEVYDITRNLYKNVLGNKIMFEEINHDLKLTFRYTWKTSDLYGFVKASDLVNDDSKAITVKVLDGIRNILPYGVDELTQTVRSTLVDGYKRQELVEDKGLGIFTLSSIISDKAEPSEALKATTVWSKGFNNPKYLLSEEQVHQFALNQAIQTEYDIKGRRGSFYVSDTFDLEASEQKQWWMVAEINQSASDVHALMEKISDDHLIDLVEEDVLKGDQNLKLLVFNADGMQMTAKEKSGYRHFSNTMFNIMRGGIYADAYKVDTDDFKAFYQKWNQPSYKKNQDFINQLDKSIHYNDLVEKAQSTGDTTLTRIAMEYLPLTFSRRHGDPSRPWNKFNIHLTKENGQKNLNFEGNWRDIFQNWEALSLSYPGYIESIIAKFVNASTGDGYNPYRITKEGIDWEVIDPNDPWSNIGYWGDHQIIYLLKLMELSKKHHADKLIDLLDQDIFVYADVPYRIKGFEALKKDPRNSIIFDDVCEERVNKRLKTLGSDGKLCHVENDIYQVNLLEKILVTVLSKLSNFIPEGGIWMNTQRPEWNDANNALVGYGISMVTLYYLHRFLDFMSDLLKDLDKEVMVSEEVYDFFEGLSNVYESQKETLKHDITDQMRYDMVEALGLIGEAYRRSLYDNGFTGNKKAIQVKDINEFVQLAKAHLNHTIHKNKRQDGLFHAYNLIGFKDKTCQVSHLYEMLEGQVAVLSSKALNEDETISVLKALRESSIYRQDQNSYMLYPNRDLPKFLEKNIVAKDMVESSELLLAELEKGHTRFIEKDVLGHYHFNGQFRNAEELMEAMKACGDYDLAAIEKVGDLFSELFNHYAFTGRSGTFYKYEGLGCIYWHMVSKLVLASQENFIDLVDTKGLNEEAKVLADYFHELKAGIGVEKSPVEYGAFTTDAYSHTPGFAGVQQPGMTGQVKEDFISRYGELGLHVRNGEIHFDPYLLSKGEFLTEEKEWHLPHEIHVLKAGQLGFTYGSVPIVYELCDKKAIKVCFENGDVYRYENISKLDATTSQKIFNRTGEIKGIEVTIDINQLNS